jgi:drug/metabolite transporter (DMT)-like permease
MERNFIGNSAAFIAAVLFGASVVATRVAVGNIPPLSLAFLRFGQGGLILLIFLLILRPGLLRVKLNDLPYLALLGAVLFTIFPITFNVGLKYTEASRGALMLATLPLWSAWLARLAKSEHLTLRQVGGIILTLSGVTFVLVDRGLTWQGGSWLGIYFCF